MVRHANAVRVQLEIASAKTEVERIGTGALLRGHLVAHEINPQIGVMLKAHWMRNEHTACSEDAETAFARNILDDRTRTTGRSTAVANAKLSRNYENIRIALRFG